MEENSIEKSKQTGETAYKNNNNNNNDNNNNSSNNTEFPLRPNLRPN